MKTFRLVPLVLAGICGYIHTVINRRFDEIGDLLHAGGKSLLTATAGQAPIPKPPASALQSALDESISGGSTSTSDSLLQGVNHKRMLNIEMLQGPAVDELDQENVEFPWLQPKKGTLQAISPEYDDTLLQYTLNLLPHHLEGSTANKISSDSASAKKDEDPPADDDEDDLLHPKPYEFNQVDIIVPASGQDDRLRLFADRMGVALSNFEMWYETERRPAVLRTLKQEQENELAAVEEGKDVKTGSDFQPNFELKFRVLITRYPADVHETDNDDDFQALHEDLAKRMTLPKEQVVLVRVGFNDEEHPLKFNRAHARNALHENACVEDTCIVTAMDVDMQVLPIFFHRALRSVKPYTKAYFPIVFSEFNPETVQLVQDFLYPSNTKTGDNEPQMLPPFSRHRGLWRDFGYGMYVLTGGDAKRFRFNEEHQGWGHEDNDFYKLVHNSMRVDRQREHGLIHGWHPKNCNVGKDIVTQQQWVDCLNSRDVMEGSILGLLLLPAKKPPNKEDFPGLAKNQKDSKHQHDYEDDLLREMAHERSKSRMFQADLDHSMREMARDGKHDMSDVMLEKMAAAKAGLDSGAIHRKRIQQLKELAHPSDKKTDEGASKQADDNDEEKQAADKEGDKKKDEEKDTSNANDGDANEGGEKEDEDDSEDDEDDKEGGAEDDEDKSKQSVVTGAEEAATRMRRKTLEGRQEEKKRYINKKQRIQ
ncbi:Chondroitin sulfate N-acetylgalactosaminyltransferase 2 [Seminavis robusta]|uniref:Chondroitin sulfate N-acetylgalactosaminyltransferase 2 n=1 Tax=Seminavis robusta TaxID=568900 RepID=A0A9N8HQR5_9STRA|nr:Chondroitin sulfate N-acetylgalactosaminyltransferase 2 [Seminavis robusta]|eukprot:Sro1224_g254010.1 Chondroitin sulfate N-acetylgalactosaminyltransferase 2 (708) ;mRNA; r:20401-22524